MKKDMAGDSQEFFDPVEDCPWRPPREIFADLGYLPAPPSELTGDQLPGCLWEMIYAAAGRRMFFHFTNHLNDLELYTLLCEQWLDEPTADIPLEAETNTRMDVSDFDLPGRTREEVWLRYYAREIDREFWSSTDPDFVLPPHEEPPHDRDRFMPQAPVPLGGQPDSIMEEEIPDNDPLGLAAVDQEIARANDSLGGDSDSGSDFLDADLEAELEASEPENWQRPIRELEEGEVRVAPPDELTDETVAPYLWESLHHLALRGLYVLHTNHLSDRQLYEVLWERVLRQPVCLSGRDKYSSSFYDLLGRWGEEEMRIWLRYYAKDQERAQYAAEWPQDLLPPKEPFPFNRDWRLPKSPFCS